MVLADWGDYKKRIILNIELIKILLYLHLSNHIMH